MPNLAARAFRLASSSSIEVVGKLAAKSVANFQKALRHLLQVHGLLRSRMITRKKRGIQMEQVMRQDCSPFSGLLVPVGGTNAVIRRLIG